jgi:hypothetical protein
MVCIFNRNSKKKNNGIVLSKIAIKTMKLQKEKEEGSDDG